MNPETTAKPKRQRAAWARDYRARRKANGIEQVQIYLSKETHLAFQSRRQSSGLSADQLMSEMLTAWDEQQANRQQQEIPN